MVSISPHLANVIQTSALRVNRAKLLELEQNSFKEVPPLLFSGGIVIDGKLHKNEKLKWKTVVKSILDEMDKEVLQNRFPPFYRETLQKFQLNDLIGIPPKMGKKDPSRERPLTTHGLIVYAALEILKQMPNANSAERALAQLFEAVECTVEISKKKYAKMKEPVYHFCKQFFDTDPIYPGGDSVKPYRGKIYSTLQTSHIVFVARNGAVQIPRLPTPKELLEMFKNDKEAQKEFLSTQPLTKQNFKSDPGKAISSKYFRSIFELYSFLKELEKGLHKERTTSTGCTDIHRIMIEVPFNYSMHIKNGLLKTVVDKPGTNGKVACSYI